MIMKELQDSMNKKLRWINCRVSVVDSDTYGFENISDCKLRFAGKNIGASSNTKVWHITPDVGYGGNFTLQFNK